MYFKLGGVTSYALVLNFLTPLIFYYELQKVLQYKSIKFQVWDLDHTNGHKLLGSIETSLREQQQFSEAAARKSKA